MTLINPVGRLTVSLEHVGTTFMWIASSSDGKFVIQARTPEELLTRCEKAWRGHVAIEPKNVS